MTQRAYKYRFYPTSSPENLLRRTMGSVSLVYNNGTGIQLKTELLVEVLLIGSDNED